MIKMYGYIIGNKKSGEWMDRESGLNCDLLCLKVKIILYIFMKYFFYIVSDIFCYLYNV